MKTIPAPLLLTMLFVALSSGCTTTPPTLGERMIAQSESTKDLGKQWQKGHDMVAQGNKIRTEGQEKLTQGNELVKEGDRLIAEGTTLMQASENSYKARFPGQTLDTKQ